MPSSVLSSGSTTTPDSAKFTFSLATQDSQSSGDGLSRDGAGSNTQSGDSQVASCRSSPVALSCWKAMDSLFAQSLTADSADTKGRKKGKKGKKGKSGKVSLTRSKPETAALQGTMTLPSASDEDDAKAGDMPSTQSTGRAVWHSDPGRHQGKSRDWHQYAFGRLPSRWRP